MTRNAVLLILILSAGFVYMLIAQDHAPKNAASLPASAAAGMLAPDFSFETTDNKKVSLEDFRGKPVIINFWASWCAPCVIEFPAMLRLAHALEKDAHFVFLSQDVDENAMKIFIKKLGAINSSNVFIGLDSAQHIARLYGTYKLPETYILNPGGRIAEKIVGADIVWDSPAMQKTIKELAKADQR
jgi:cytochrome c biogenesis protein CcmG, thiol:disulfide interchange protein DsbE